MSALGDYVHLNTANYLLYGTTKEGPKNSINLPDNYLEQRTKNIKGISQATLIELRKRVANDSLTQTKRDNPILEKKYQDRINRTYEALAKYVKQGMLQDFIDVTAIKPSIPVQGLSEEVFQRKLEIYNEIKDAINAINRRINNNTTEEEVINLINLYNELDEGLLSYDSSKDCKSNYGKLKSALIDVGYDSTVAAISGRFGEELVNAARDVSEACVINTVKGTLEQGIVGGDTSQITLNRSDYAVNISSMFGSDASSETTMSIAETQDKVDVRIIINSQEMFASVKSKKDISHDGAKMQSNLPLLHSLTFLNKTIEDFGNHWLNIHAATEAYRSELEQDKEKMDKLLKEEIAYEALVAGNPLKSDIDLVNTFVLIDRVSGKVFAYDVKDILINRFNHIRFGKGDKSSFTGFNGNISRIILDNSIKNTPNDRILELLKQIHSIKLLVTYRVSSEERNSEYEAAYTES